MMTDDMALLHEYSRHNSEEAFDALVSRHVNLVYSVALRQVRDTHLAEEITQVVFIILSKKAGRLPQHTVLSGWLCRTARYASANALTIQRRRQHREQEAYMQSTLNEPENEAWMQIAPVLDTALAQLGETDHDAIVLRFFEGKSMKEVGLALGVNEDAAKKRVNRAVEKLQKLFLKRRIASTTATLAGAISSNSVQAAPAMLAKSITAVAITKGAAASGSTLTLIKGALKIMAWTKAKTVLIASIGLLLAVGTATVLAPKVRQIYIQSGGPAMISITNASSVTVSNVMVCGEHFSTGAGMNGLIMTPNMSATTTLTPYGLFSANKVWLFFDFDGKQFDSRGKFRPIYYEVSSRHPLTLTIGADLSVTSSSGINSH
jgi:RNA polymerase sigma factor (sigma-70 family)